jgi:hypothetical protein
LALEFSLRSCQTELYHRIIEVHHAVALLTGKILR